jgi:hypothetical protein
MAKKIKKVGLGPSKTVKFGMKGPKQFKGVKPKKIKIKK